MSDVTRPTIPPAGRTATWPLLAGWFAAHVAVWMVLVKYAPGDDFVERLIAAHRGLSDDASRLLNARLVLLLANHIGDAAVLDEAIAAARAGLPAPLDEDSR